MSKIVEFKIGKGVTQKVPGSETEHTRKYLELTVRLPEQYTEDGFYLAVQKAEQILDEWMKAPETASIPQIDSEDLKILPWTSYQTHQPCQQPDEAGWIWADPSRYQDNRQIIVITQLRQAIEHSPKNKFELGEMLYTFSGPKEDTKLFISRRKIAKKKAEGEE